MEITVLNRQRTRRVDRGVLQRFLGRAGRAHAPAEPLAMTVCLVSDRRMREFNRRYRDKDTPTDVLSFPAGEGPEPDGIRYLGDVVISVERAARQARERGHSLGRELKLLALHGYLHLLGYDHETDDGEMQRLERRLARRLLPRAGGTGR